MNWRISALDRFTLVSNSDAHSPSKLAREANLFDTELSFSAIAHALAHPETDEFLGTLEFYPEEGKYHMDGHRGCKVCLTPAELAGRLEQELGKRTARRVAVGTFHSLCIKLLRDKLGEVTLIDEAAALAVVEELCVGLGLKKRPRDVLAAVSARKNGLTDGKEVDEAEQTLFAYYCERLEEYGVLDYDDLILQTLALFEQGAFTEQECEPFRRLLVDEFQDINPVQYRLMQAWNRDGDELFVIGDPDQAIYGFRGSDPLCFETLARD